MGIAALGTVASMGLLLQEKIKEAAAARKTAINMTARGLTCKGIELHAKDDERRFDHRMQGVVSIASFLRLKCARVRTSCVGLATSNSRLERRPVRCHP